MRLTNGREETNFVIFTIISVDLKVHKTKTRKIKLINKCISLSFLYFDSQDPFLYIFSYKILAKQYITFSLRIIANKVLLLAVF